jgi:hypothetical protein
MVAAQTHRSHAQTFQRSNKPFQNVSRLSGKVGVPKMDYQVEWLFLMSRTDVLQHLRLCGRSVASVPKHSQSSRGGFDDDLLMRRSTSQKQVRVILPRQPRTDACNCPTVD